MTTMSNTRVLTRMARLNPARVVLALPLLMACGEAPPEATEQLQAAIIEGQTETGYSAVGCLKSAANNPYCDCTGTLIGPSVVLSAKHCGELGTFQLGNTVSAPTHVRAIDRRIPWYPADSDTTVHDLQLYHLASPIYDVRPLPIRTWGVPANGTTCTIVGFGGGSPSKESATVYVKSSGGLTNFGSVVMESEIEVVKASGMAEPGDSGGPLFCDGVLAGACQGFIRFGSTSGVFYTALDTTRSMSASWVTNAASNFVNEPMVSAVAWDSNRMDLFVRGTNGAVYHKAWTGSAWSPSAFGWESLGGFITGTPEAVSWGPNRIDVFVRGGDTDLQLNDVNRMGLFHLFWNGSTWTWQDLGGILASHPAVVSWGPNRLDVFGVGTDGGMYHQSGDGQVFSGWEAVPTSGGPSAFLGPVKAISVASQSLDLYAVGADNMLYHIRHFIQPIWVWVPQINQYVLAGSHPAYSSWTNLGGPVEGTPAVVTWGGGREDIFVKMADNRLHQKVLANNAWLPSQSGFYDLGGTIDGSPAAASMQADRLTLISNAPNNATNDKLVYKGWFNGSQWYPTNTTWLSLGSITAGVPTLLATPPVAKVRLFSVGSAFDPGVSTYTPNGPSASYGWTGLASLGGTISW